MAKRKTPTPPPDTTPLAQAPAPPQVQLIAVAAICPSPTNPRKTFDPDELQHLADSIRQQGIKQPLRVRPIRGKLVPHNTLNGSQIETPAGERLPGFVSIQDQDRVAGQLAEGSLFELVDGERRLRAAKGLALQEVPCLVADLTDEQAMAEQMVANEQRADVPPLERADAYHAYLDRFGLTIDQLAVRIGKSASTVRGLLRLRNLPATAREALDQGVLPVETATLIARLPTETLRADLAHWVLASGPEVRSSRATREEISRSYLRELKGAPFSQTARTLLPEAGSCKECPKRAGNLAKTDPDYASLRADMCCDPDCFGRKEEANAERERAKLTPPLAPPPASGAAERHPGTPDRPGLICRTPLHTEPAPLEPYPLHTREEALTSPPEPHGKSSMTGKLYKVDTPLPPPPPRTGPSDYQVRTRAAAIAASVLYEMGANNPDGLDDGLMEMGDSSTCAAWEALKLLCLARAERSLDQHDGEALAADLVTLPDPDAGGEADAEAPENAELDAFRAWIDAARPSQLLGFLLKGDALEACDVMGSYQQATRDALLDWGEMHWPHLLDQARRELLGEVTPPPAPAGPDPED